MAGLGHPQGYDYKFVNKVGPPYVCMKCKLVARELVTTSCCGESFCDACISAVKKQQLLCPECKEGEFKFLENPEYRKYIERLQVYCSLKQKGCGWSGPLKQLEHHMTMDCRNRDHKCRRCNFRATYEEVERHLPECKYCPMECQNRCGVTCERGEMEYHLKICRLQDIPCEFRKVGCTVTFKREEQEHHMKESLQQHLWLTALQADQVTKMENKHEKDITYQHNRLKELDRNMESLDDNVHQLKDKHKNLAEEIENLRATIHNLNNTLADQNTKMKSNVKELKWQQVGLSVMLFLIVCYVAYALNTDIQELKKNMPHSSSQHPPQCVIL